MRGANFLVIVLLVILGSSETSSEVPLPASDFGLQNPVQPGISDHSAVIIGSQNEQEQLTRNYLDYSNFGKFTRNNYPGINGQSHPTRFVSPSGYSINNHVERAGTNGGIISGGMEGPADEMANGNTMGYGWMMVPDMMNSVEAMPSPGKMKGGGVKGQTDSIVGTKLSYLSDLFGPMNETYAEGTVGEFSHTLWTKVKDGLASLVMTKKTFVVNKFIFGPILFFLLILAILGVVFVIYFVPLPVDLVWLVEGEKRGFESRFVPPIQILPLVASVLDSEERVAKISTKIAGSKKYY